MQLVTVPAGSRRPARRRRRAWLVLALCVLAVLSGAAILAVRWYIPVLKESLRSRAVRALQERFHAELHYRAVDVQLLPALVVTADDVAFQGSGASDFPPLIQADRILVETDYPGLLRHHIRRVRLDGLAMRLPLKHGGGSGGESARTEGRRFPMLIDQIEADTAQLELLRSKAEKPPLEFEIHHLRMSSVDLNRPAEFQASLTNPQPRGEINTRGLFGPWDAEEPSQTPVSGRYTFSNADLATFKGIGGILSSEGKYQGVLKRIEVDGETDTPNFFLRPGGNRVLLHTSFHSIVDGTNGNTWLQPVNATIRNSTLVARGEIVKHPEVHGRALLLDVIMNHGRLEDLLRLAVKSARPPMTGAVALRTHLHVPPGRRDVADKMQLDAEFNIQSAQFTSLDIQERLRGLSRKGLGKPRDQEAGSAVSNLRGHFQLKDGLATFSDLLFELDGAAVNLKGQYNLESEQLDFRGKLFLDAKLSQTTTGPKALLLKAVDPFFRKNGRTELPIKVTGTRSNPAFGLNFHDKSHNM